MNQKTWIRFKCPCLALTLMALMVSPTTAQNNKNRNNKKESGPTTITLGREGSVVLKAPADWKRKKPRFNMIEYEFAVPAAQKGQPDARVTIMGAGGDVKQNMERWKRQFHDQGRKFSAKQLDIVGQEVHVVDIAGTYLDRPAGPMAGGKTTPRKDYRVLAAILVTTRGRYYVKMIGPRATVSAHEKAFQAMLKSLQIEQP